ncbi:hypothetical protein J7L05_06195 [bacterium]|nr:hypothetical protein [bacterium]
MTKYKLIIVAVLLLALYGCSNQPVTPDRITSEFNPEAKTFQLALVLAGADYPNPERIPTDVPTIELINPAQFGYFASYALAAFDIYWEPSDWDDWMGYEIQPRTATDYEPSDWDDWMSAPKIGIPAIRRAHDSSDSEWLEKISEIIDPLGDYEPSDWDDWMSLGNYVPSDWDNWLVTATIDDLTNLN